MNQKQYHSLEELPLMMNMADVAAVLGIFRAGAERTRTESSHGAVRSCGAE